MTETYMPADSFRPFSNGSEYRIWLDMNCCRGEKGCRSYKPNATSSRHPQSRPNRRRQPASHRAIR